MLQEITSSGPDVSLVTGFRVKQPGAKMVPMPLELAAVDHSQGDESGRIRETAHRCHERDSLLFVQTLRVDENAVIETCNTTSRAFK